LKNITFIIPCYNCEKTIIQNYLRLKKKILNLLSKKRLTFRYEIFYINDGSNDNTLKKLLSIKDKNIKIINNNINLGKSTSIIKAIRLVKTNFIILLDCDLPYLSYLNKVIYELNFYDLVLINRRLPNSKNIKSNNLYQKTRKYIGEFIGILIEIRHKLNVHGDTQAGLKGFKLIKNVKNKKFISKYYFLDFEIIKIFRERNLRIKLLPVNYSISKKSNIKIFSYKNILILIELIKILLKK